MIKKLAPSISNVDFMWWVGLTRCSECSSIQYTNRVLRDEKCVEFSLCHTRVRRTRQYAYRFERLQVHRPWLRSWLYIYMVADWSADIVHTRRPRDNTRHRYVGRDEYVEGTRPDTAIVCKRVQEPRNLGTSQWGILHYIISRDYEKLQWSIQ